MILIRIAQRHNSMDHSPDHLHWHDSLLLGNSEMDQEHEVFVAQISALQSAADRELPAALTALLEHATAHFAAENASMSATNFPSRDCHMQEHEAVLATLRGVHRRLADGQHSVARALAAELAAWFPAHVQHLDSALSHWISKQRHGGKPIVLHRRHTPVQVPAWAHDPQPSIFERKTP